MAPSAIEIVSVASYGHPFRTTKRNRIRALGSARIPRSLVTLKPSLSLSPIIHPVQLVCISFLTPRTMSRPGIPHLMKESKRLSPSTYISYHQLVQPNDRSSFVLVFISMISSLSFYLFLCSISSINVVGLAGESLQGKLTLYDYSLLTEPNNGFNFFHYLPLRLTISHILLFSTN